MLRFSSILCRGTGFQIGLSSGKTLFPEDQRGRFNLSAAAAELGIDEGYAASLYKPLHYTFSVKGQRYPGELGRSSRPGSQGSSNEKLFPLYSRNYRLDRELRNLDPRSLTTS